MIKLLRFLKGYWPSTIFAPLFKLMEALFELIIPLIVAHLIDEVIPSGDSVRVWKTGGLILLLGVAGFMFSLSCQFLAARASLGFGTNVRTNLYKKINSLSHAELDRFNSSSLVTRVTNDTRQVVMGLAMFIRLVLRSPFITVGAIVMAMLIDLKMSLIFLATGIVVAAILYILMTVSARFYKKIQRLLDNVSLLASENLSGARVVRAFSRQDEENQDFLTASQNLAQESNKAGKISALLNPLTYAVINIAIIMILYFGAIRVTFGELSQGEVLALVNYMSQILLALLAFATLVVTFTKATACAKRINEVFDAESCIVYPSNSPQTIERTKPLVSFKNVSFSYQGSSGNALEDISFDINAGETVGIIGSTGSGKSTLVNLICRFYDVTEGKIEIFGADIKDFTKEDLSKMTALVPQTAVLFCGTVKDNMLWGKADASDSEIWDALKIAQADEFVRNQSHELDSQILQGGKNLSGGQRQRLTIARALVKNPQILILDDSLSALDYATDAALRRALRQKTDNMTVIMVSQRATSLKKSNKIIVLDDGRLVGLGTHSELLKTSPIYSEICSSQISGEQT